MKIQVPEPCNENWNAMNPQQKGRFCGACQKVVIDFTLMSDSEIVNHFQNYKGNTCGRFYETQLNTNLVAQKHQKSTFWSRFLAASFTLFFFSQQSYSQNTNQQTEIIESNHLNNGKKVSNTKTANTKFDDGNYFKIKGKIIDTSQHSISDALVSIKELKYSQITDENGNFEMIIAKEAFKNQPNVTFEVTKFGYTTTYLEIGFDAEKTPNSYIELILKEAVTLEEEQEPAIMMGKGLGESISVPNSEPQIINGGAFGKRVEVKVIKKRSLWSRFKRLFVRKQN